MEGRQVSECRRSNHRRDLVGDCLGARSAAGYQLVGMTVGKTALGGNELVAITRRVTDRDREFLTRHADSNYLLRPLKLPATGLQSGGQVVA